MASFPTPKVHRNSRRKFGRGQTAQQPQAATALTLGSGNTAIISFDRPVVVSGNAALTVGNTSILGQTVTSPTELTVQLSGNASGKTYSLLGGNDWAATTIGGGVAGSGGTF